MRNAPARAQRTPWALLLLLMVLHALPYAWSTVILDTARDLVHAQRIVDGESWPLRGPVINAMFHLGPAWYYVLALPLALLRSVAGTLALVGLLASLKFPLAYACGVRVHGRAFAVALAIALALPGWNLAQQLLVTHWNLVEAAVLATAYALIVLAQRGPARWWLAYGALQGAALHAHPSTIVIALALPLVMWRRRASWRGDVLPLAAGLVLALAWFAPMLLAEVRDDWPMLAQLNSYVHERAAVPLLAGLPALADGALRGGVALMVDDLASNDLRLPLLVLYVLVGIAGLAGFVLALASRERRGIALALLGACALALLALRALRPLTPFYMLLPWLPLLAALLALALDALRAFSRAGRMAGNVALAAIVLLQAGACALLIRRAEQGVIEIPVQAFGDVALPHTSVRVALLPAWRLDQLGAQLCDATQPVVLHGHLAVLVDSALSLGSRVHCGRSGDPSIGGGAARGGARHVLGLVPRALRALGHADAGWADTFALTPARVVAAPHSQPVPDGSRYPFRERGGGEPGVHVLRFATDARERVVVTHAYTVYDGARTRSVRAGGAPARELFATSDVAIYECATCAGEPTSWELEIETSHPERIDVVVTR